MGRVLLVLWAEAFIVFLCSFFADGSIFLSSSSYDLNDIFLVFCFCLFLVMMTGGAIGFGFEYFKLVDVVDGDACGETSIF